MIFEVTYNTNTITPGVKRITDVYDVSIEHECLVLKRNKGLPTVYAKNCWITAEQVFE